MSRINDRRLEAEEFSAFIHALRDAFSPKDFKIMLRNELGWRVLDRDAEDGLFTYMLDQAEDNEQTLALLDAVLAKRPSNKLLIDFARRVDFVSQKQASTTSSTSTQAITPPFTTPVQTPLQRRISELHSSLQPVQWRTLMERQERCICLITIQSWNKTHATGFLVGPDVVITNYHVLKDVINGPIPSSRVSFSFDYKLKEDRKNLEHNSEHQLATDNWLLDHSEHDDLDERVNKQNIDITERHLDYALLRLKRKAGEESNTTGQRGWIEIPEMEYPFKANTPLLILHHPNGETLTFDIDTRSVITENASKTRVRYTTNTENGSSGAPCFDANWDLVALHQSGDPDFTHDASYNQGIPIAAILRSLKRRNNEKYLGGIQKWKASTESSEQQSETNTQLFSFEEPESLLSEKAQQQLASLLDKPDVVGCTAIPVTKEMLTHLNKELLSPHADLFLREYIQITSKLIEKAKHPFNATVDLLPKHFKDTSDTLDLMEECIRKITTLLRISIQFIESSTFIQLTVDADNAIGEKRELCRSLMEEKGKYRVDNSDHIKRTMLSKFNGTEKTLHTFLSQLPRNVKSI